MVPRVTAGHVEKYQFDGFELFPKQRALWRSGVRVALMPKPLDTLVLLVEHAGQTVSKEDPFAQVWNGAAVEENNLTQSISTLRKALGEKRGENRYIVTEPGRGYRFVAAVSWVMEPAIAGLDSSFPDHSAPPPALAIRRPKARLYALGLLLLVVALTGWFILRRVAAQSPARRSVAVLRIRDLSKTSTEAWLRAALTEMLTSELSAGGKLRAIPAEDVARWRADLGTAAEEGKQADLLRSAQQNLGADALVLGSYVVTGICPDCRVRVDLGLSNARKGDRFGTIIEEGSAADLLDLTSRLGRRLRAELGVNANLPASPRWPTASAMREYAEGLKALRLIDPLAARDHLQTATAEDPANPLIHAALADAWTALGYLTRSQEENRRAYDLSGSLDRLDQLGIEARYRASVQQWDRAIEIYKTIFQLFPDSLDDGLNLARTQLRDMKIADANATLSTLRRLPKPAGNDPRIDLNEAQAAGVLNDYVRTRDLARRAAKEAKARGARYLFARARLLEGGAMQNMNDGNWAAVQAEARETCEAIGDRDCLSKAWRIYGNERFYAGDFQAAQQAYRQGVAIARELGNRAELANLLVGFGVVAKADRDWQQAEQHLLEAISLRIEAGNNPNEVRNDLVEFYITMGRLTDAEQVIQAANKTVEKLGAHEDLGEILRLEAALARSKGELDRAEKLGEHAAAELRRTKAPEILSVALAALSSIHTAKGDLTQAAKDLTEAGSGLTPEVRATLALARAELSIAQRHFPDAVKEAQKAAAAFDQAHEDGQAARALVTAADALQMLNRNEEALVACREAEKRAMRTPNQLPIALAQLCSSSNAIPHEVQVTIAKLHNPELTLRWEYARAVRAKRTGARNYRVLCEKLTDTAAKLGYMTLSRSAASLAQD